MTDSSFTPAATVPASVDPGLITYTNIIYALHALSVLVGIVTTASVLGSFLLGWPSIIAVIMNYVRRSAVQGTFLESHFSWQIRTFWWGLLWVLIIFAISVPLMVVLVGFATLPVGLLIVGLWVIYRVVRGWSALSNRRPMYA